MIKFIPFSSSHKLIAVMFWKPCNLWPHVADDKEWIFFLFVFYIKVENNLIKIYEIIMLGQK